MYKMVWRRILLIVMMFAVMAVPAMAAINNAQVYQPYDGALTDETGNGYIGTLVGTASIDTSLYHVGTGSLTMNGIGNQLNITNFSTPISADNAGSISMWVYPKALQGSWLTGIGNTLDNGNRFRIIILNTGVFQVSMRAAGTAIDYEYNAGTYSPNNWYHLVLTQDGTTGNKFYVNGVNVQNNSGTEWFNDMSALNRVVLGGRAYGMTHPYNGNIDEWAYYDYALNDSQVAELYNNGTGFNPYTAGPPAPFNITAANAETAAAINTFNVTLNGTLYSTTNGTIIVNQSGYYNTTIQSAGYIPVTTLYTYAGGSTTQWNLTSILRNVTVTAVDGVATPLSNFNVSINGTPYNVAGTSDVFELDRTVLHNFTFTKTDYYSDVQTNVNVTSNVEGTLVYAFVNTTFTAQDETNASLSNFNVTIGGTTYNIVNASGNIEFDSRELFNATWSKTNYLPFTATNLNPNSSQLGNLTEYFNILVYTNVTFPPGPSNATTNNAQVYQPYDGALTDETGNGYIGTLVGNASIDTSLYHVGNGSLTMNGTGNQLNITNFSTPISADNAGSISMWVYPKALQGSWLTGIGNTLDNGNRFRIITLNTGVFQVSMRAAGTAIDYEYNAGTYTPNNWYHLVLTQDGTTGNKFYVNGVNVQNNSGTEWFNDMSALNRVVLGGRAYGMTHPYNGNIDEWAYYDYALNESQIAELYNNGTGFNPYFTGPGTPVFNTTDDYYVTWNSTNYYPQADNITYLPVRYSLENFTVNPTTIQYKQAVYTNYNTTTHLNLTFNNSHAVTATNRYNSSAINNFTVETPTQNYTAINGTAYLQNDTGVINYTVSATDYFDAVNAGVDVTNGSSNVLMHQVEVRFSGTQRFTNNTVADGNVTIGPTTRAFGEPFYLNAGTYEAVYTSSNDEANPINFTYTVLTNTTSTITNITNANLTIIGTDAITGAPITFFTTSVVNNTLFISLNETAASPHLYNLIQNVTYTVQFDNSSYALGEVNLTLTNRSTTYNFTVYTTNSFDFNIFDEITEVLINDSDFNISLVGSYASYNLTYVNGSLYVDLIVPDFYRIEYQNSTKYGLLRNYFYTLTNRTYNNLSLYAIEDNSSTEITVQVLDSANLQRREGNYVLLQRHYISDNAYRTVAMYETDVQGNAYFDVEQENVLYKFVVQDPFGTNVYESEPFYLQETSYSIFVDTAGLDIASGDLYKYQDISYTVDWDNVSEKLSLTYTDPSAAFSYYNVTLYAVGVYTDEALNTSSSTSPSGTLTVGYNYDNDTNYYVEFSVSNSPKVSIARIVLDNWLNNVALSSLRLFLASVLFIVVVFVSSFSIYGVVVASTALIAAKLMGLIAFSGFTIGGVVFAAILLAMILEFRR